MIAYLLLLKANWKLALALAALVAAFAAGWAVHGWRFQATQEEVVQARFETFAARQASGERANAEAVARIEQLRQQKETLARRLDHEVTRDPYRTPISAGGLQALRDANAGTGNTR